MSSLLDKLREALPPQYDVERELASGGMGAVFLGRDRVLDRPVAIKVLHPDIATDRAAERFLYESRTLARLKHPNIVPVYQAGESGDISYYVMEYIEGETLEDRLKRGPLGPAEAVKLADDLLSALGAAHEQGLVHRDVKPANIFLLDEEAVLTDFGIAKRVEEPGDKLTVSGYVVGTPAYMAPEQIAGGEITPATDVYAAAMVLYEALTGRRWQRPETPELADWSGLPARLEAPIRRALSWSPGDRWRDAAAFREALSRATRGRAKRLAATAALSTMTLAVVGIASLAIWQLRPEPPPPAGSATRIAVLPFSVRAGGAFDYLGDGMVDLLSTKLDGAGELRSADPRAIINLVEQGDYNPVGPEEGQRIAGRLGAGLFVLGSLVEVQGNVRLDARLYGRENGQEALAQASAEGGAAEIFAMVDDLAAQLLVGRSGGPGAGVARIAAVTTSSLDALKYYLQGEQEYRAGRFARAAREFQRATEADSAFALAWYRLSTTGEWLIRGDLVERGAEQAVRHSERLPDRVRRLLEATLAGRRGDFLTAEAIYRDILSAYPDDVETWFQLGELLFHFAPYFGRSTSESRDAFERVLAFEPDAAHALIHLMRIEARTPDAADLDSLLSLFVELEPESERIPEARALREFAIGDGDSQARILSDLRGAEDRELMIAATDIPVFTENLRGGEAIAELLTETERPPELRSVGYSYLGFLRFAQGLRAAAHEAIDTGAVIRPALALEYRALLAAVPFLPAPSEELRRIRAELEVWDAAATPTSGSPITLMSVHDGAHRHLRLYLLGLLSALLNENDVALRYAQRLTQVDGPDPVLALAHDLAAGVRAQVSVASGNTIEALATLEETHYQTWYQAMLASPFYGQDRERYLRAVLLAAAGREEEALTWFNSFAEGSVYGLAYLAPSHLARAEIYERRGEAELAARHYRRFIELWSESDPDLEFMVQEAERAVERTVNVNSEQ